MLHTATVHTTVTGATTIDNMAHKLTDLLYSNFASKHLTGDLVQKIRNRATSLNERVQQRADQLLGIDTLRQAYIKKSLPLSPEFLQQFSGVMRSFLKENPHLKPADFHYSSLLHIAEQLSAAYKTLPNSRFTIASPRVNVPALKQALLAETANREPFSIEGVLAQALTSSTPNPPELRYQTFGNGGFHDKTLTEILAEPSIKFLGSKTGFGETPPIAYYFAGSPRAYQEGDKTTTDPLIVILPKSNIELPFLSWKDRVLKGLQNLTKP